jgi:glutathione synthase
MSLNIAFQMDHIETLSISGDTTFALCLEAQKRGHKIFHYTPDQLTYKNGKVTSLIEPLKVMDDEGKHFNLGDPFETDFIDIDFVLMRQEPPFNMHYITYTHILEHLPENVRVINNPASVRNAPEKLLVTFFKDLMPETLISLDADSVLKFQKIHKDIVLKPLYGKGGEGIIRLQENEDIVEEVKNFIKDQDEPIMVQPFLPEVKYGDKRIIILDGEPVGCLNRIPAKGEFRSNLGVGGIPKLSELSESDIKICDAIKPTLKEMNLVFVGIDVIGKFLTEINVTCPTGVRQIKNLGGPDIPEMFWRYAEDLY